MSRLRHEFHSTFWATVDLMLAVVGVSTVLYPAVSVGNVLVGSPLADETVPGVVVAFAVAGAYPFVEGHWSLGALGDYIFTLLVCLFVAAAVMTPIQVALGLTFTGTSRVPQAAALAVAYPAAYWVTTRSGFSDGSRS